MNRLIHSHDVTKRCFSLGEPVSSTFKAIKSGQSHIVEYTPSLPGGSGFIEAVIWEQADEFNNKLTLKYNGYCFILEKSIVGKPIEYVTIPYTVVQYQKYTLVVTLNPDWTCQLSLDGVDALPGFGAEIITNGDFLSAINWVLGTGWTISAGKCNGNLAAVQQMYQVTPVGTIKFVNRVQCNVDSISGTMSLFSDSVYGPDITTSGLHYYDAVGVNTFSGVRGSAGLVCVVDNFSMKQIYNSTTTLKPTYRGYLGGGQ